MSDQTDDADAGPEPCPACRGTGQVVSNLGGSPSTVTCPWCEGSGVFTPDHDAQLAGRVLRGEASAEEVARASGAGDGDPDAG